MILWVVKLYGKGCAWGTFREAWIDYLSLVREEGFFKVRLYPKLSSKKDFNKLPEHTGW